MRAVVQRVLGANVTVDGEVVDAIGSGLLVYLGITHTDTAKDVDWMAAKIRNLRILREERSVEETGADVLVVSQFTLYGDARKGRRPTWQAAAPGEFSEPLYQQVADALGAKTGRFGADMQVSSVNDGPITLILDSP